MIMLSRVIITAKSELLANKGRSIITAACIAVAIAAFAIIMQLGSSAQRGVSETVERTQGRTGTVRMTASGAPLSVLLDSARRSAEAVRRRELATAWGLSVKIANVRVGTTDDATRTAVVSLQAVDPGLAAVLPVTMSFGRWFDGNDATTLALPVVLGPTVARDIAQTAKLSQPQLIGRTLTIRSPTEVRMRIVGIVRDGPMLRFIDQGGIGFVPLYPNGLHPALTPFLTSSDSLDLYLLDGGNATTSAVLKTSMEQALIATGQVSVTVDVNRIDKADDFADASRALATLLSIIGGIALVIGVIGVTNVSLMAVRERTREFGLRRALGSSSAVVSSLVMTETFMIILIGGLAGVLTATILSWLASTYLTSLLNGVPVGPISASTALLAVTASAGCGVLAGLVPAWRAHRLTVIQAIRD